MLYRIDAILRPYYSTVVGVCMRDTVLLLFSMAAMCSLLWYAGHTGMAASLALTITISETVLRLMFTRRGLFAGLDKTLILRVALVLASANSVLYSLPSLVLAAEPSIALKIAGLIFAMGMQVYLANAWSGLPVFIYALLLPSMVMLSLVVLRLGATDPVASSTMEWAFAVGVLILFIYSAIETLRQQIATHRALSTAERAAARQLNLLRDAQRLDPLTRVLNREAFDRALDIMLDDRRQDGSTIAVYLLDLDAFKPVNDTYSHDAGDEVLRQIAARLEAVIGANGIVGRLGGDEFICAVGNTSDDEDAIALGRRMQHRIAEPIVWDNRDLRIRASVGIAMTDEAGAISNPTVPELCSAADQAMFAGKSAPDSDPVLYRADRFTPRLTAQDRRALIHGIAERAIKPHYQPKIHLPSGAVVGFEALARWAHHSQSQGPQAAFIDQINDLGLQGDFMVSMTRQVMEDICAMLDEGLDPGQVSLNVPEVALATRSGLHDLRQIVEDHRAAIPHLTLEITEDVFIARAAGVIQSSIATLRSLGVRISLDDFGTGFASFNHLHQLDFDELKIDTAFIAGLGKDASAEVLVRGFLTIASGLGVAVVAEGVETEDQRRDLINMGCLTAQGYLFSEAIPFADATDLLRQQTAYSSAL